MTVTDGLHRRKNVFQIVIKENADVTKFITDYRQTQILVSTINAVFSDVGPLAQATWISATIAILVGLVRSDERWHSLGFLFGAGVNLGLGIIYNQFAGAVYEESKEALMRRRRLGRLNNN
ncbi:unnamed protein product [Allacma fusca]|uniref:Uncharacterized protein n=1 Tax=Allacma fusca TaxID=39272 RepID=A0A8J2PT90_9HEXA|nr:unnamed protein product [Allacma fusca]